MLRILWNNRSSMIANQEKLDCISNNISNVQTDGYKRIDATFSDLMYESLVKNGYPLTNDEDRKAEGKDKKIIEPYTGSGVKLSPWYRQNTQGVLKKTGKESDFAINGRGYFKAKLSDGREVYTRGGSFIIDAKGQLVDKSGNKISVLKNINGKNVEVNAVPFNDHNKVMFDKNNFSVNSDGDIIAMKNGKKINLGKIKLYDAVGENALISIGENMYIPKDNKVTIYNVDSKDSTILQGYLEGSNVRMEQEMTDMITTQRAFELSSRGIKVADEMWAMVNNLGGR